MPKKSDHLKSEAGAKTQFGQPGGPDPSEASKSGVPKWSIRKQLAYLAAQEVDVSDPKAMQKLIGSKATVATVIAATALAKAAKGDMSAVNYATDNIDGKLAQVNELTGKDGAALQQPIIYLPGNGRDSN